MSLSVLRRLAALVGLIVAMAGVIALATPAQAASTPRCKGNSCSNKDPQSMGCGKDARTIDKIKPGGGGPAVELRRSAKCRASWARLAVKANPSWDFRLEVKNGPYYLANGSLDFKAYTRMSGSTQLYRACIKQYQSDGWSCTRWHPEPAERQPTAGAAQLTTSAPTVPTPETQSTSSAAGPATEVVTAADTLCNVNQNTWVRKGPGTQYNQIYTIPAGGGFRITGPRTGGWVLGHGNGGTEGYIPNDGRLYNC